MVSKKTTGRHDGCANPALLENIHRTGTADSHPAEAGGRDSESDPEIPGLSNPNTLPESYWRTRVILLPVGPYVVHAYWEYCPTVVSGNEGKAAPDGGADDEKDSGQAVLRFYDVTDTVSCEADPDYHFDIEIDLEAGNWYVHLWEPGRSYYAELGFRACGGRFSPVARSNIIHAPGVHPSDREADEYIVVDRGDHKWDEPVPDRKPPEAVRNSDRPGRDFPEPDPTASLPEFSKDGTISHVSETDSFLSPESTESPDGKPPGTAGPDKIPDLTEINEKEFVSGISSG